MANLKGLIGDKLDIRDYKVEHILWEANVDPPRRYVLDPGDIYDQGRTMHCVAYSTTKIHEIENTIETGNDMDFVPSKLAKKMEEDGTMTDKWAYLTDWLKAVCKYGSDSDDWLNFKATWYAIIPHELQSIRERIYKWYPILTWLYTDEFDRSRSKRIFTERAWTWWHAVCITGYDDNTELIIITNSRWDWYRDNWNFYIRYKDINRLFKFRILYDTKNMNNLYKDLTDDSWAYEAVKWATEKWIVKWYDDGTFRPDALMTRAEVVQVLYNMSK